MLYYIYNKSLEAIAIDATDGPELSLNGAVAGFRVAPPAIPGDCNPSVSPADARKLLG